MGERYVASRRFPGSTRRAVGTLSARGRRIVGELAYRARMAGLEDVRRICAPLPRSYEAMVRDYVKFRVGRLVYASVSPDESLLGFGFPKEARESLVAAEPDKFLMPARSDLRYNWVRLRLPVLAPDELEELLVDAWAMCVPKFLMREYLAEHPR